MTLCVNDDNDNDVVVDWPFYIDGQNGYKR